MKNKYLWTVVFIVVAGFILYAPNLHNRLFWDDNDWIVNNPYVHNLAWNNLKFIFSHDALAGINLRSNYYRPVLFFTFMLNYIIAGVKPLIYHLTNNLIHIANALLLFFLLDKFLKKRFVAILASLLFLIHPLQTEAITYISGRGDPMSVLFMLLALLFFLKSESTTSQVVGGKWRWKLLSLGLLVLALLSRETAFLFPLYLMVFLIAFIHRERFWVSFKKSFVKALPYFGTSLVYGISRLTVFNFQNTLNFYQQANAYSTHLSYRLYTFFHVLVVYFKLIFVPTGLHMEREAVANGSLFQWPAWLGALMAAAIILALFLLYKKERKNPAPAGQNQISTFRLWFFAWGFFFLNLAPTSGIIPINALIYEHWLYFSLFGFFALLAFYLDRIFNFLRSKTRPLAYIAVILFSAYLAFLGVQTVRRNILWGKIDVFYQNILKYEPQSIRVLNNLALYYSDHDKLKEAEDLYWRIVGFNDIIPAPYYNLGNILRDRKDYAGALELYKKAIELDPYFSYAYMNTAAIYAQQGLLDNALDYLEKLKAVRPTDALVYFNIGRVQFALGQKEKAIQSMRDALKYSASRPEIGAEVEKFLNSVK